VRNEIKFGIASIALLGLSQGACSFKFPETERARDVQFDNCKSHPNQEKSGPLYLQQNVVGSNYYIQQEQDRFLRDERNGQLVWRHDGLETELSPNRTIVISDSATGRIETILFEGHPSYIKVQITASCDINLALTDFPGEKKVLH